MTRLLLAVATAALAVAAGCGDSSGSGEESGSDEDQIVRAIQDSVSSNDPSVCTELLTPALLEQIYGSGDEALGTCEESQRDEADQGGEETANVSGVAISGDAATAEAMFQGGSFDGQSLRLGLVRENSSWKLNEIIKFIDFDRASLIEQVTRSESLEESGLKDCTLAVLRGQSDEILQSVVLGGEQEVLVPLLEKQCPDTFREQFVDRLSEANPNFTPQLLECLTRVVDSLPDDKFFELIRPENQASLQGLIQSRCS